MMLFQVMKNDSVVIAFAHSPLGPQQLQNEEEEELRMFTVLWAVVHCSVVPLQRSLLPTSSAGMEAEGFSETLYSSTILNGAPYSSNLMTTSYLTGCKKFPSMMDVIQMTL